MFAILWIFWIAKKMLCGREMLRSALLSCCLMFSCHYLLMISAFPWILRRGIAIENHKLTADRREGNVKWHCGAHSLYFRLDHVWYCLIIARSGFAKQARNLMEIAQLLINYVVYIFSQSVFLLLLGQTECTATMTWDAVIQWMHCVNVCKRCPVM